MLTPFLLIAQGSISGKIKEMRILKTKIYSILTILVFMNSCTDKHEEANNPTFNKTNMEEPNRKIDSLQLNNDLKFKREIQELNLPLSYAVFPTNKYVSLGNGSFTNALVVSNKRYIYQTAMVFQGEYNSKFFNSSTKKESPFLYVTIVLNTMYDDSLNQMLVTSRNHPIYLSQGFMRINSSERLNWIASNNISGDDFCIINMKYFNLNEGNIIIVLPQEDGSLNFRQIMPNRLLNLETIEPYLKTVLEE